MPGVPGVPGRCGETVRVGFGAEFGGTDMVQGKVVLGVHRAVAFHSVVRGNACVWMRTWAVLASSSSAARSR